MRRESPKGWVYCSSFDQGTIFDNEDAARAHDASLIASADVSLTFAQMGKSGRRIVKPRRFPTTYTYTHTRTTSQLHDKPQGPHTFAFCQVNEGFNPLTDRAELLQLFYEQVPSPEELEKMLLAETKNNLSNLSSHVARLNYDYISLYNAILALLANESSSVELLRYYIRRIMEMHTYGTYCWKIKNSAGKRSIKSKGERRDKIKSDTAGKWEHDDQAKAYLATRAKLHKGDYKIPEEDLQNDGPVEGQYMSMDELIDAIIIGEEVLGNTIHLFPTGAWEIVGIQIITVGKDQSARVRLQRRGG